MPGLDALGVTEFAKRVNMTVGTIRNYSSVGKLPPPDGYANDGDTKLWKATTIDRWNDARKKR